MLNRYAHITELPMPDSFQVSLGPLREKLMGHKIYHSIETVEDLRVFMEHHIFAVWDFMSLLKTLQSHLTCVSIPWVPQGNRLSRRLINEIVLAEESDTENGGGYISHFELYRAALEQVGADTSRLDRFVSEICAGRDVHRALEVADVPKVAQSFVKTTWRFIESGSVCSIATAFTLGREDLIPDMFIPIVAGIQNQCAGRAALFLDYLERHIQLDGEHHTPMAMRMLASLCGNDENNWKEVELTARVALNARMALWDGVVEQIEIARSNKVLHAT
ncbi:MAG TPA: DUF3050 domain-containing protein [Blastocatellia bacterium]|jgi:hypothetical protein|nr:DUF3050 domain-containing protein [Blastocatellia bacterium]